MAEIESMAEPAVIVILGASGDLTQHKLGLALHSLVCAGLCTRRRASLA